MLHPHQPQPFPLRVRVAHGPRDLLRFPEGPDELGHVLLGLVEAKITEGRTPAPAVLAFSADSLRQYDVVPVLKAKAELHRFVSAVSGSDELACVALLGVPSVRMGRAREGTPAALAFVEWADGSWWSGMRILKGGKLSDDLPALVRSADEGWPRPGGLGGWWARGRREGLRLSMMDRQQQAGQDLVH